jgi:hypothetical protein
MNKYFISFATQFNNYTNHQQQSLNEFLKFNKFQKYYSLNEHSLDSKFLEQYSFINSKTRGFGYWLWKPHIINKFISSDRVQFGDIIFYVDSTVQQVASLQPLFNLLEQQDVIPWIINDGLGDERDSCKRDAFILTDCDNEIYWTSNKNRYSGQYGASYICLKKTEHTVKLIHEWYNYCCNENIITDEKSKYGQDYSIFNDHRHDQAVWSLLCKKYNIKPIHDITQYGNPYRPTDESWGQLLYHNR